MPAQEVAPESHARALLPGAEFADAFTLALPDDPADAATVARRMIGRMPRWVRRLLALRKHITAPLGLKHPKTDAAGQIGIFPILTQAPDRIVLGLDDKHLDFRLVVDLSQAGSGRRVTATTVVKTHNLLGRTYLAAIMPFHRVIARTMVNHAAIP